jgi:hypothetical protein
MDHPDNLTMPSDFAEAFWPRGQKDPGFQPEPGCSEPTFVGSAADIAFFASSFFNFASRVLANPTDDTASAIFVRAATNSTSMSLNRPGFPGG